MLCTRRDAGRIALAALPLARSLGAPGSRIHGVQIGVITYSFRGIRDLDEIIKAIVQIGINAVELMSNSAETAAGAPSFSPFGPGRRPGESGGPGGQRTPGAPGGGPPTPEQMAAFRARMNSPEAQKAREELRQWRLSASMDKFKDVLKKFDAAGLDLSLLCFNMDQSITGDEIDYAFQMAKALGARAITSSTQVSVAKRVAPFADKHKMMVGYHGHDNVNDPNEFATLDSFAAAMSYSAYNGINLDIGHFTASNLDPIGYLKAHHGRITNVHLKDRKRDHGPNTPWGQGDTPIREVLQLMKAEKYPFPANIEYEYRGEADAVTEVAKCFQYCKEALG